jgi:hypothetical protein
LVVHQINIKMQSGVNLNEVVVVGYGKTTSQAFTGTLNKLKLVLERKKRYKYFSSTSR